MNKAGRFARRLALATALLGTVGMTVPVQAQFSKSYEFLDAVKKRDGQKVTDALNKPGTQIVNTRDVSTGRTALHIVTDRRDLLWLRFLIAHGADTNAKDNNGVTPLMIAVGYDWVDGVQELLAHGARVDETDDTGTTPLITAVHQHDAALARLLLKHGANPDRPDNSGRSARDYVKLDGPSNPVYDVVINAKSTQDQASKMYGPSL